MGSTPFEVRARDTAARAGLLTAGHDRLDTPALLIQAYDLTVPGLSPADLSAQQVRGLMVSVPRLLRRPGADLISEHGGVHRLMGWTGLVMADGGHEYLSRLGRHPDRGDEAVPSTYSGRSRLQPPGQPARLLGVDDGGVDFTSHVDGARQRLTPEGALQVQEQVGIDIMVALAAPLRPREHRHPAPALERAKSWARRSLDAWNGAGPLFGVVDGSFDKEAGLEYARAMGSFPFSGFAVTPVPHPADGARSLIPHSGRGTGEGVSDAQAGSAPQIGQLIGALPPDRPRLLMGVDEPLEMLDAVRQGVDLLTTSGPVDRAQRGLASTPHGYLDLCASERREDFSPINPACRCIACTTFSRAYVHHLFDAGELLAARLVAIHNIVFAQDLIREVRKAIARGSLPDLIQEVTARWT